LGDIATRVRFAGIKPPAIIVVGEVVALRDKLNWYETRPLFGKNIIVTRARQQASEFSKRLGELGANAIEFPTIEVVPPDDWSDLDKALSHIQGYDWVVFTSVNGVRFFLDRLRASGRDLRALGDIRIATIGPKTAEMWRRFYVEPDLVPEEYRAEAIVEGFRRLGITKAKVLIPRAREARKVLPDQVSKMGLDVDVVTTYKTVRPAHDVEPVREMLSQGQIHMVTFTSSSTVKNFVSMFEQDKDRLMDWMQRVAIACIGPITAQTAHDLGFSVDVMPKEYTIEALVNAVVDYWGTKSTG
jgi:uroporphyrinogen III methyltransferase/synthase